MGPPDAQAVLQAFLALVAYQVFTGVFCGACTAGAFELYLGSPLSEMLAAGNFFWAYLVLEDHSMKGTLSSELPALIFWYVLFHGLVTALCLRSAVRWLRITPPGGREMPTAAVNDPGTGERFASRPPLGEGSPLVWKEVHVEAGAWTHGRTELNQMLTVFGVCYGLTFLLAGIIASQRRTGPTGRRSGFFSMVSSCRCSPALASSAWPCGRQAR